MNRARAQTSASTDAAGAPTRTYRGRTIDELIPKIQDELGADAIILRRREGLTGGFAGFFQRQFVELEAMRGGPRVDLYDEDLDLQPLSPERPSAYVGGYELDDRFEGELEYTDEHEQARTPFYEREPPLLRPDGAYVTERLAELARAGPLEPSPVRPIEPHAESIGHTPRFDDPHPADPSDPFAIELEQASSGGFEEIATPGYEEPAGYDDPAHYEESAQREEPAHTRFEEPLPARFGETVWSDRANAAQPPRRGAIPSPAAATPRPATPRPAVQPARARARAGVQAGLLALGVSERFAGELIDAAAVHVLPLAPRASLSHAVGTALTQRIPVASPLPTQGAAIVVVGPGGSGKTSCCATLLGAYRKGSPLPASCATLIRGSGKGELEVLLSPYLMKPTSIDTPRAIRALRKARSEGLLVVDTPPLSAGDRSGIRKLAGLLGELKPERVVIALPATLGAVATRQLVAALRPLGANALAVTHADETDQIGVAVEAACTFGLAPEYTLDRERSGRWRLSRIDPTGLAAKLLQ
jgi:SRP54-type protein, GTPase domain